MLFIKKYKKLIIFIICLIVSFLFLLFATKSSFLYPTNDWVDSNAFFTLGRGMINGKVIYKDLFEQKGPLLYFIHAIATLISSKSFIGVYIMELLSFSIYLYYSYKLLKLFLNDSSSLLMLPILSFLTLFSYNFSHGDSAEEFCLPLLMISLYYFINYLKNNQINTKIIFFNGIIAGLVLTIKYTMLGFWFSWMMLIFFSLILNKNYKDAFKYCFIFLLGMSIPLIPWIIYFIINNGLREFINAYFIFNMTSYSNTSTLLDKMYFIYINFFINSKRNFVVFILIIAIAGFIYLLITNNIEKRYLRTFPIVTYTFLLIGIYFGGVAFRYYYLITLPFMIFGLIFIGQYLMRKDIQFKYIITVFITTILGLNFIMYKYGHNAYFMKIKKEDLVQHKFAKIISKENNPTILNYGFLDGGFYLATNTVPNTRYFQLNNINYEKYPLIFDTQKKYVQEKEVQFVITRRKKIKRIILRIKIIN